MAEYVDKEKLKTIEEIDNTPVVNEYDVIENIFKRLRKENKINCCYRLGNVFDVICNSVNFSLEFDKNNKVVNVARDIPWSNDK